MRILFSFLTLTGVLLGSAVGYRYWAAQTSSDGEYQTEPITRGDLLATFSATGTVEPEDVIDVGTQVAGMIKEFGPDAATKKPIDYGSHVEPGSVLAVIDDSLYKAKVEQSRARVNSMQQKVEQAKARVDQTRARVEQARANVLRAEADLKQSQAKLAQADRDWERARRLGPRSAISQLDFDTAQAAYETNRALVGVAEAALVQAKAAVVDADAAVIDAVAYVGDCEAAVADAQAVLRQDEINLDYCTIRSPVKGVIIDRRVTLGQTVQSSFNAPSLFLLARDLRRMKVWASVNEADIGQVRVGQPVRFTVDAHPGEAFRGEVGRVRFNAAMTQNVVTYTVEVVTDNANGKLLPYLTANLRFEIDRRNGVLLVPNAALRWQPAPDQIAPAAREVISRKRRPGDSYAGADDDLMSLNSGRVWIEDGDYVQPVTIKLGLSDGNMTEMLEGDLEEGSRVIVNDVQPSDAGGDGTKNPFAPPSWGRSRKR